MGGKRVGKGGEGGGEREIPWEVVWEMVCGVVYEVPHWMVRGAVLGGMKCSDGLHYDRRACSLPLHWRYCGAQCSAPKKVPFLTCYMSAKEDKTIPNI